MALRPDGSLEILQEGYLAKGSWHVLRPASRGSTPRLRMSFRFYDHSGDPLGGVQVRTFSVHLPAPKTPSEGAGGTAEQAASQSASSSVAPLLRLVDAEGRPFVYRRAGR